MVRFGEELIAQFFLMKAYVLVEKVWFTQLAIYFLCCTFITVLSAEESASPHQQNWLLYFTGSTFPLPP